MDTQKTSKWSNFCYYYKWHVVIAAVVLVIATITIRDCHNSVEPDISIRGILNTYVGEESKQALENTLYDAGMIPDLNADGKQNCLLQLLTVPEEVQSEQDMAVQMQIMLGFAADEAVLYLIDEEFLELYEEQEIFEPLDTFVAQQGVPQEQCYVGPVTGQILGVSLQGNALLEQCGIKTDTLYLAMRVMRQNEQDDQRIQEVFDASGQIAAYLYQKG